MANKCKECGCFCKKCLATDHDVQLHVEIENLKQKMVEKENHIVMMETNFLNEANKFPSGELVALRDELLTWQDKYKRLYEAHRRVQRVNQGLEDKLLKLVDICETDKNTLTKDVAILSHNLAEAKYAIKKLTEDNERYKNDVNLAIQFLQCKQTNFVAHRFDSLPSEVQTQVAAYMTNKRKPFEEPKRVPMEPKSIKVPIPTFPPTAMVYSVPKSPKEGAAVEGGRRQQGDEGDLEMPQVDIVSAAIMAKVLEERQKDRAMAKHCDSCTCAKSIKIVYDITHHHVGTQTGNAAQISNLCLKCNDVITSLSQPTALQIVKPMEDKTNTKVSPYPNLSVSPLVETSTNQNQPQNVVKVQPNNFLIEKTLSEKSEQKDLIDFNDITIVEVNEKTAVHHNLCNQKVQSFNIDMLGEENGGEEKKDLEKRLQDTPSKDQEDTPKGPRYASLRLQTGSKNILLDNAHNNIAPVLYTRTNHNNPSSQITSQRHQPESSKKQLPIESSSASSYQSKRRMSVVSENSTQHQQRINDWVQITVENDNVSSPDNSRTEDLKIDPKKDKAKFAEMEENVKRFLFGESDFWKTVEIGKLKYQSYQEGEKKPKLGSRDGSRTSSHTETEI